MNRPRRQAIQASLAFVTATVASRARAADAIILTDAERAWIAATQVVRYGVTYLSPPFVFLDRGRPRGILVDLLERIGRDTGLEFEYQATRNRDDALSQLERGEIDLVPLLRIRETSTSPFLMTDPVAQFAIGVYTRVDVPYVDGPADLAGLPVGVPEGLGERQRASLAGTRVVAIEDTRDGFERLRAGGLAAVIAPVPIAQHWQRMPEFSEVWLQVTLPERMPFGMGVARRAAPLVGVVNAVLRRVSAPERRALRAAWVSPAVVASPLREWAVTGGAAVLASIATAAVMRRQRRPDRRDR